MCEDYSPWKAGYCSNGSAMYYATVVLDDSAINAQIQYSALNPSVYVPMVIAHQLGHSLRLADVQPTNGICSEMQDIMYGSASMLYSCGIHAPVQCDQVALDYVYANAPITCSYSGSQCLVGSSCN